MITTLKSDDRGHLNHGWLDTYHSFSFGEYHDPARMGFRALRVINEDVIGPGQGFGLHPHRDMEILTYIITGKLAHQDSMKNTATIVPGRVQRMSAGTGIRHAEFNPSETEAVHLLQIWLQPDATGHAPSYEEMEIGPHGAHNMLRLLASPDGAEGSTTWHQDARLYAAKPDQGHTLDLDLAAGRHAWLQVVSGDVDLNGTVLAAGDAAAVSDESRLRIQARSNNEFLLFDLA